MKRLKNARIFAFIGALFALSACGQKGALYLPEDDEQVIESKEPVTQPVSKQEG